jgi:hypothetical protein
LLGRAVVPGLLVAIALSSDQVISVQLWIAAGAVWIGAVLLWDFIAVSSIEPARLLPAWRRRTPAAPERSTPKAMLAMNALLANARRNPRAHANQLRPQLIQLAGHFIPIRYGFDPAADPERFAQLLGVDAWLVDPGAAERTPTVAELHRFLDLVLGEGHREALV